MVLHVALGLTAAVSYDGSLGHYREHVNKHEREFEDERELSLRHGYFADHAEIVRIHDTRKSYQIHLDHPMADVHLSEIATPVQKKVGSAGMRFGVEHLKKSAKLGSWFSSWFSPKAKHMKKVSTDGATASSVKSMGFNIMDTHPFEIHNQGKCGSCWAVTLTIALKHMMQRVSRTQNMPDLSVQHLLCQFRRDENANHRKSANDKASITCQGSSMNHWYEYQPHKGICSADSFPYQCDHDDEKCQKVNCEDITNRCDVALRPYELAGHIEVPENDGYAVQVALVKYGIATAAIAISKPLQLYKGGVFNSADCGDELNHAVVLTGFGRDTSTGKVLKYWIIANSWSDRWGERGTARISMDGVSKNKKITACGLTVMVSVPLHRTEVAEASSSSLGNALVTDDTQERLQERLSGSGNQFGRQGRSERRNDWSRERTKNALYMENMEDMEEAGFVDTRRRHAGGSSSTAKRRFTSPYESTANRYERASRWEEL